MDKNWTRYLAISMTAALSSPLVATSSVADARNGSSVMVFNGDGRYLQLDASGHRLASGLYDDLKAPVKRTDGSLIADVHSADNGTLYALLARDAQVDEGGAQRFSVVGLDAHTLKVTNRYDLPQAQTVLPRLLLDGRHNELLMLTASGIQALSIRADGGFEPAGAAATPDRALPVSPHPYIDEHGKLIDGDRVFDRQGHLLQEVRPDAVLDASLRDKFDALTRIKGSTNHYYGTILAASAGDRMVFTVGWDREDTRVPQAGVVVYDLNAGHVISSFFSQFPVAPGGKGGNGVPSLHLSPDGRWIVIEQYEWLPRDPAVQGSREVRYRTGKLAIYSAGSGTMVGTVTLGNEADPRAAAGIVGYSRDAGRLYYRVADKLWTVDLEKAQAESSATLPMAFDPVVAVSDR